MLNLVLVHPKIPQNTGSIGRMCVCLDARLHLIRPLGFSLDESHVRRAGLDYWQHVDLNLHDSWDAFLQQEQPERLFFASTRGTKPYWDYAFQPRDYLVFGCETSGLPESLYQNYRDSLFRIPMPGKHQRSLNLATSTAIIAYEAYRQITVQSTSPVAE